MKSRRVFGWVCVVLAVIEMSSMAADHDVTWFRVYNFLVLLLIGVDFFDRAAERR